MARGLNHTDDEKYALLFLHEDEVGTCGAGNFSGAGVDAEEKFFEFDGGEDDGEEGGERGVEGDEGDAKGGGHEHFEVGVWVGVESLFSILLHNFWVRTWQLATVTALGSH